MEQVNQAVASLQQEVSQFINKSNSEIEESGKLARKTSEQMASLESKLGDINAQLLEMEQQNAAHLERSAPAASIGQQFAACEQVKAMANGQSNMARFEIQNAAVVGNDTTVAPDRSGEVVPGAFRKLRIVDSLAYGTTSSNAVEYTRENLWTPGAAERAEGATMGEAQITFELINQPVALVSHYITLSKQVVNDAPRLASYVDNRMRHGVRQRLDHQLINGDGLSNNIGGFTKAGHHTAFTPGASTKPLDNIRRAMAAIEAADYEPSHIYLNPLDVEAMDLDKGSDGHYTSSLPREFRPLRPVWGLPVISSNAVPQGKFLVADGVMASQYTEREGVVVELSPSDGDNFKKGLISMRAECRGALEIYAPAAVQFGDLTA